MEFIIAGATSYIGERFISQYHTKYKILALGRNEKKLSDLFSKLEVKYMTYDLFFTDNSKNSNDKILINFAFPRSSNSQNLIEAFNFTESLYTNSVRYGVNKIINISSQSIYDYERLKPAKEIDLPKPFNLYGIAKYYSEAYLREFSLKNNIEYLNIRLGSVIGPGFNQRFVNKLIINYMNEIPIEIVDNYYQHSFIFIDDLLKNLEQVVLSNIKWNDNYNLGSDNYYTISNVMEVIEKVMPSDKSHVVYKKDSTEKKPFTNRISNDKIKQYLDCYYDIDLKEAIKRIYIYQNKNEHN